MTLSTKHKVYGTVVVVGVIAVAVDRAVILPDQATAGRLPSERYAVVPPSTTPASSTPERPAESISTAQAIIADRLKEMAVTRGFDLQHVPNAFVPPKSWVVTETPPTPPEGRGAAETFEMAHVLTGVMAVGDRGYAIIDGKTLFIGQELDGFELISVSERSAVLEADGERIELVLADRPGS